MPCNREVAQDTLCPTRLSGCHGDANHTGEAHLTVLFMMLVMMLVVAAAADAHAVAFASFDATMSIVLLLSNMILADPLSRVDASSRTTSASSLYKHTVSEIRTCDFTPHAHTHTQANSLKARIPQNTQCLVFDLVFVLPPERDFEKGHTNVATASTTDDVCYSLFVGGFHSSDGIRGFGA